MEELDSCELGTKVYWDNHYKKEINNYEEDGDVGDIWFGEDIVTRIIRWLNNYCKDDKSKTILDVGCGNGMLLSDIYNEGYTNLKGIDYSPEAIKLAVEIAKNNEQKIDYQIVDLLEPIGIEAVDIVLDKGTYDAVSLSESPTENRMKYIENVYNFVKDSGVFVITSCNWTESELTEQFGTKFEYSAIIPTPQFKFGGKVGNVVSSVVFKRKK